MKTFGDLKKKKKRLFISNKLKVLQKDRIALPASNYITCYSRVWIEQIQKVQGFLVQVALNLTTNKSFKYQDAKMSWMADYKIGERKSLFYLVTISTLWI